MASEETSTKRVVEEALLQSQSDGVLFSRNAKEYNFCEYYESNVNGYDETYIFPCESSLDCCGRKCCDPAPDVMPLWLILLLILLLLLLLCICCSIAAWIWYKCRPKKEKAQPVYEPVPEQKEEEKFIPSPMEVAFLPAPKVLKAQKHSEDEISREQRIMAAPTQHVDQQRAHIAYYRPFVPSHMEEHNIPSADRLKARVHDVSEISNAQMVAVSHIGMPEEQKAHSVFYRPALDNVPSY